MSSVAHIHRRGATLALLVVAVVAAPFLSAWASLWELGSVSPSTGPILVQDGAAYVFEPAGPGSPRPGVTAEQAYGVLLGKQSLASAQIPDTISATYGYLTEDDTTPPADRMPVWAFRWRGLCVSAFKATQAQCDHWTFARASDGKDLAVGDQRTVS